MRREVPLAITFLLGMFFILDNFVNKSAPAANWWKELAENLNVWTLIIIAFTYILGVGNVLRIHLKKIALKQTDWRYSIWTVIGLLGMILVGLLGSYAHPAGVRGQAPPDAAVTVTVDGKPAGESKADSAGRWKVDVTDPEAMKALAAPNPPVTVAATLAGAPATVAGIEYIATTPIRQGSNATYDWIYDAIYTPMQATMFSLLAFFISSAAFRAFRIRSLQAGLLAITALIVIVGRVPLGEEIWSDLPRLVEWIMSCLQNAGKRAILIGAALGAVSTGLKMIWGVERTYLSGD